MKLLKDRKAAIVITIIIVVLATLAGVGRSLNRLARDIEAMFYDGVYLEDEGYTQPGINSHLENSANAALGLATIMSNYPELADKAEALLSARRSLIDEASLKGKSSYNQDMGQAFADLLQSAKDVDLAERDVEAAIQHIRTFTNAQASVAASRYHEKVSSFGNETSFIVQSLKLFLPVRTPEVFDPAELPAIDFS